MKQTNGSIRLNKVIEFVASLLVFYAKGTKIMYSYSYM